MTTEQRELRVMFSKRRDQGLVMGRTLAQLVFILIAMGFVVLFVRSLSIGGAAGGPRWGLLVAAAAIAPIGFIRVHGRGIADVGPAMLANSALQLVGQREYRGGPYRRTAQDTAGTPREQLRLGGTLQSLEILGFEVGEQRGEIGVVFDRVDGTVTVVMQVVGKTYPLLDSLEANSFALGFQRMQDGMSRRDSPIAGIQCLERIIPDLGEEATREWHRRGGMGSRFSRDANERVLSSEVGRGIVHESLVAIRIDPRKAKAQVKEFGGGDEGRAALAFKVGSGIERDLQGSGVEVLGWLPPRGIAARIRSALDPSADAMVARRGGGHGDSVGGDAGLASGVTPAAAEPSYLRPARGYVAHNDRVSRTWWIEEYPRNRQGVHIGFLQPLLLEVPHRHTVSILLQPVERRAAERQITERASTNEAKAKIDRKFGRRRSRAAEREEADLDRTEVDLTEGSANYKVVTLVSATGSSKRELELISADVEAALNGCSMEGQIWYVETDQAFCMAALPLARGLL